MSEQGSRSFKARPSLLDSVLCGCYYCCKIYSPLKIRNWEDYQQTAVCPKCGIDAVVPFDYKEDNNLEQFEIKLKKWNKESF